MDAELRFHIAAYAEDLRRNGVSQMEAMRRARLEFGGIVCQLLFATAKKTLNKTTEKRIFGQQCFSS
jgi:hypothetical protein